MSNCPECLFVLTGGPGSGKSSLLDHLALAGYGRSVEAGSGIIQDQVAIGGHALPWHDPAYESLINTYARYDYELIEVPRVPMDERLRFLLSEVCR